MVAKILAAKLGANAWQLSNNRTLGDWSQSPGIPSRLFMFPIEFVEPQRNKGKAAVYLNHPLIGSHPLVARVQEAIGQPVEWEPYDEFGRDRGSKWRYFHALDLFTADHYQILLDTAEFTDPDAVASGADYALRYNHISPGRARTVMLAFGIEEPADRSAAALDGGIIRPDPSWTSENGKPLTKPRFGMNSAYPKLWQELGGKQAHAWAMLHGIEDGWFTWDRSNFITMTPAGCERLGVDLSREKEKSE